MPDLAKSAKTWCHLIYSLEKTLQFHEWLHLYFLFAFWFDKYFVFPMVALSFILVLPQGTLADWDNLFTKGKDQRRLGNLPRSEKRLGTKVSASLTLSLLGLS